MRISAQMLAVLALGLGACRAPVGEARAMPSGPYIRASWNQGLALEEARARLEPKGSSYCFEVTPEKGQGTVVCLTRGWSESRTVNLLQYETVVMVLREDRSVGRVYELTWADRDTPEALRPGGVVALGREELAVAGAMKAGRRAGTVKVLECQGSQLKLEVHLAIPYEGWYVNAPLWIRIQQEWKVDMRRIKWPCKVRPFPKGANEEVGEIRLGPLVEESRKWYECG